MIEGIEDMSCMLENMSLDEVAQLEGALAAAAKVLLLSREHLISLE